MAREVHLTTRIDFGKYREHPQSLKSIIDSGERGLNWAKWLMDHSWNFTPSQQVTEYIEKKKLAYGLLQQDRSK